ncbi:MAG: SPOR domain-containing protein, partial [bacterium]|nr:SPOR domain-containing protein [bacterium]
MSDSDKSYLEIKVTFHHIVILLVGVILIGIFLFFLGLQAGKTSDAKESGEAGSLMTKTDGNSEEINFTDKAPRKDPDKIEEVGEAKPRVNEEIKLHKLPGTKPEKREEPQSVEVRTAKATSKVSGYSIQVGAFHSHQLAKDYSRKFSRAGYATSISQATVKGKIWYRVRVGSFENKADAK